MNNLHPETVSDWATVDRFLTDKFVGRDVALDSVLSVNDSEQLPAISVSPLQGKFMYVLARLMKARHILEVGTLGGYSTTCFARAIGPEGRVTSLELDPHHAEVSRRNVANAGVANQVDIIVGTAEDSLRKIAATAGAPRYDLIFIDADKDNNCTYIEWALRLGRKGGAILVDNIVWGGGIVTDSDHPNARGARAAIEMLAGDERMSTTVVQSVCFKGWDGFSIGIIE